MIFRKPYAFLIKNFKKIHILLLVLCSYIFYKTMQLTNFINEFTKYLSYDNNLEPITKYTSIASYLILIILIATFLSLLVLLRRKNKPWKLYLISLLAYISTLISYIWAQTYFNSYAGELVTKDAIAISGFLLISRIPQYVTFVILLIRITGLDLNRFGFQNDKEFLELDEDDRDEFEVSVSIDKHAFKRTYRKYKRSLGYFYEEHKWLLNIVLLIIIVVFVVLTANYFMMHKTVGENNVLNANGYSIKINKSYYTNKNQRGEILEKNSSFVILNVTVKNNGAKRKLETSNFHLVNGKEDITFSESTYVNSFIDIGKKYTKREFRNGEVRDFAMIFKVDKNLDKDKFVLYYQQYRSNTDIYLRKIKINLVDLSNINTNEEKKLNEKIVIKYPNDEKKEFVFTKATFENNITYTKEVCDKDYECKIEEKQNQVESGFKILKIDFSSNDFEGEELIDFSIKYGKIIYIDKDGITRSIDFVNELENYNYLGKNLFIKVPADIELSSKLTIVYTIRNQKYLCNIR